MKDTLSTAAASALYYVPLSPLPPIVLLGSSRFSILAPMIAFPKSFLLCLSLLNNYFLVVVHFSYRISTAITYLSSSSTYPLFPSRIILKFPDSPLIAIHILVFYSVLVNYLRTSAFEDCPYFRFLSCILPKYYSDNSLLFSLLHIFLLACL